MNPRLLIALLVVLLAIVIPLAACGGGGNEGSESTDESTDVVTPLPPGDGGTDTGGFDEPPPGTETDGTTPAAPPTTPGGKLPQVKIPGPPLQLGDNSKRVKQLQQALIRLKLLEEGAADGDFGAKTKRGVQAFQLAEGLKADGIAGKQTLKKINKAVKEGAVYDGGQGTEDSGAPPVESVDTETDADATSGNLSEPAPGQETDSLVDTALAETTG